MIEYDDTIISFILYAYSCSNKIEFMLNYHNLCLPK
jgi:hypothetical protein